MTVAHFFGRTPRFDFHRSTKTGPLMRRGHVVPLLERPTSQGRSIALFEIGG